MTDGTALPRRQLEGQGYARGEETRARIVDAALRVFGEHGYDQASTRQIAAAADVNPPALQYYFGGKEGLHRACAQYIVDLTDRILSPAIKKAEDALSRRNRPQARTAVLDIVAVLSDRLGVRGTEVWSRFIARGRHDGAGPAMQIIRERMGVPLIAILSKLIALARGESISESNRLRALIILAPVSWLHGNRDNALAVMRWQAFDAERVAVLKSILQAQVRAVLTPESRRRRA